jgi:hypothetical protein
MRAWREKAGAGEWVCARETPETGCCGPARWSLRFILPNGLGFVHHAHLATAQDFNDAVMGDGFADWEGVTTGENGRSRAEPESMRCCWISVPRGHIYCSRILRLARA